MSAQLSTPLKTTGGRGLAINYQDLTRFAKTHPGEWVTDPDFLICASNGAASARRRRLLRYGLDAVTRHLGDGRWQVWARWTEAERRPITECAECGRTCETPAEARRCANRDRRNQSDS